MRIHKIDNERTRRHMYKDAPDVRLLYFDRDELINKGEDWWRDQIKTLRRRVEREMFYKYGTVYNMYYNIYSVEQYDLDYNRIRVVVETKLEPKGQK